jgi:STAM-binding protein
MPLVQRYATDFVAALEAGPTLNSAQNGAFIHTCHTHCEAFEDSWSSLAINGVTMQQVRCSVQDMLVFAPG